MWLSRVTVLCLVVFTAPRRSCSEEANSETVILGTVVERDGGGTCALRIDALLSGDLESVPSECWRNASGTSKLQVLCEVEEDRSGQATLLALRLSSSFCPQLRMEQWNGGNGHFLIRRQTDASVACK